MKQHLTHVVIAESISMEVTNFQRISPTGKCHDLSVCEPVATQSTGL